MQGTSAEEPLLVASAKCSYSELLALLETIEFDVLGSKSNICLPAELAKQVLQFLVIERVDPEAVEIVGCSSHDKIHPLAACLSEDETTWWISGDQSMPRGRGCEYVQLSVGPILRRLAAVSIKIPPLPQGPLSVREFRIDAPSTSTISTIVDGGEWNAVSQVFTVDNRTGFQRFVLADPVDVHQVRLVCLTNQIDPFASEQVPRRFECVGFFSVRLD